MEIIKATAEKLVGYGKLVDQEEYKNYPMEIVRWPKPEGIPIDEGKHRQQEPFLLILHFIGMTMYSKEKMKP